MCLRMTVDHVSWVDTEQIWVGEQVCTSYEYALCAVDSGPINDNTEGIIF
jgi:hypothetical protein